MQDNGRPYVALAVGEYLNQVIVPNNQLCTKLRLEPNTCENNRRGNSGSSKVNAAENSVEGRVKSRNDKNFNSASEQFKDNGNIFSIILEVRGLQTFQR